MELSRRGRCLVGVTSFFGVIGLVGMLGLIHCERLRIEFPGVYFRMSNATSPTISRALIALIVVNIFTLIIAWPLYFVLEWKTVFIVDIVFCSVTAISIIFMEGLKRIDESGLTYGGCEALSDNVFLNLGLASTDDMFSRGYYDALEMTYMTSAQGAKELTNATMDWVYDKCQSERLLLVVFYIMMMVFYGPVLLGGMLFMCGKLAPLFAICR